MDRPLPPPARLRVHAAHLADGRSTERDRTVLIEDGRVVAVDRAGALPALAGDEVELGGPSTLVLPGFVNAHQHGMPHGFAVLGVDDGPLEPWMVDLLVAPGVDPYGAARTVAAKQLRAGITTTVHHQYTFAPSAEAYDAEVRAFLEGYRDGGLRVVFAADLKDQGEPVHFEEEFFASLPPGLSERARELAVRVPGPDEILEVFFGIRADVAAGRYGAAELILGPSGPVWCSDSLLQRVAQVAGEHGFGVTSHVLESPYEREYGPRAYGGHQTVPMLDELGILNGRFFLSHGCQLTRADAELLAQAGASVVTNPGSNLRLHNGVAPVSMLLDAGVNVAIGTDSLSLGDHDEILDELRLMQALQRRPGAREEGLGARTLLRILTEHGARAIGRTDVGELRPGASADLVLVDLDRIVPAGASPDPVAAAIGVAHPADFSAVISQGRVVARDGVVLDPAAEPARRPNPPERNALIEELMPYVRDHYAAVPLPAVPPRALPLPV